MNVVMFELERQKALNIFGDIMFNMGMVETNFQHNFHCIFAYKICNFDPPV
jgi:hypothetical protein